MSCGLSLALLAGCGSHAVATPAPRKTMTLTRQQISTLDSKKIFFGHQSVGYNMLEGIREITTQDGRIALSIRTSTSPELVPGPGLVESPIGKNGDPKSKLNDFAKIINNGLGSNGGVALMKFCYVDIDALTDVNQLFASYRDEMDALKREYPRLKLVYVTIPLTTVEPAPKAWIKSLLGRTTQRDLDAKRNEFNRLLRQTYGSSGLVFDLAEVESTRPDGSRSYFLRGDDKVYTMAPELTSDGGHLNEIGRRAAAERLLELLSRI